MFEEFTKLFGDSFDGIFKSLERMNTAVPVVELVEKSDRFELAVKGNGFSFSDVSTEVRGNSLKVEGTVLLEGSDSASGKFSLSYVLPQTANLSRMKRKVAGNQISFIIPKTNVQSSRWIKTPRKKYFLN